MRPLPRVALSIQQPWAWLIVNGWKDVENRDWPTRFRARVLIHTGKRFDQEGYDWVLANADALAPGLADALPLPTEFELGGIVGVARVTGCVTAMESPWFFGEYGFVLAEAEPLPFQPLRGLLKFFAAEYATAGVPHA